jgi:hypothetical protein
MRPTFEVHDREAGRYFRHLEDFLGSSNVDKRLAKIERELAVEKGIYRLKWLIPRRQWWLGLKEGRNHMKDGKTFRGKLTELMRTPLKTAIKISHLYKFMDNRIRGEYASRILADDNMMPTLFEIDVAAQLYLLDYSIAWSNPIISSPARVPEFMAKKGDVVVEVECKTKSIDAGRKIERPQCYRLSDKLINLIRDKKFYGEVHVVVKDRMPTSHPWQDGLCTCVSLMIDQGKMNETLDDGTRIRLDIRTEDNLPISPAEVQNKARTLHKPHGHLCVIAGQKDESAINPIVLVIESDTPDRLLADIKDNLEDANQQFSGNRSAIICCYIPEVDSFELLKDDSGLNRVTADFFNRRAGDFVSQVIYSSDADVYESNSIISEWTQALKFDNPNYNNKYGPKISLFSTG